MAISGDYRNESLIRIACGLIELNPNEKIVRELLATSAFQPNDGDVGREVQAILYGLTSRDRVCDT